jgi:hypothetical protein
VQAEHALSVMPIGTENTCASQARAISKNLLSFFDGFANEKSINSIVNRFVEIISSL